MCHLEKKTELTGEKDAMTGTIGASELGSDGCQNHLVNSSFDSMFTKQYDLLCREREREREREFTMWRGRERKNSL
jgi:hypothetical protein